MKNWMLIGIIVIFIIMWISVGVSWSNYTANDEAAIINDITGKNVACVEWIIAKSGYVVVACDEK